jgi:hypothetical protein
MITHIDRQALMDEQETAAYYDDPDRARQMCLTLMRARREWAVWREPDRIWRARHDSWPDDRPPLESANAGLLNRLMATIDAETATTWERAQTCDMSAARGEVPFWAGDPT